MMDKTKQIANYLVDYYKVYTGTNLMSEGEVKLQKLMYYAQKTSFSLTGYPLFEEDFVGWIHGPVLKSLRGYKGDDVDGEHELSDTQKHIIERTIHNYGDIDTWELRDMTHAEWSWSKSRQGLSENEKGRNKILKTDIQADASNERLYDHLYDMYYDEFDDFEEGEFVSAG